MSAYIIKITHHLFPIAKPNHKLDVIRQYTTKVLDELNIRERDPKKFLDEHFEVDW